ncbi:MAG: membrane-bound lytic murein transglycosylase MltF [Casimicrobiaceae bacterium]
MRDRSSVHRPQYLRLAGVLAIAAGVLVMSGCEQPPAAPAQQASLSVVVRPGPTTWFAGPNGRASGLDHDLLTRFARERGLVLKVAFADDGESILESIANGEAQIGAGGLFRRDAPKVRGSASSAQEGVAQASIAHANANGAVAQPAAVNWTSGYDDAEPVLIYNVDGYKPKRWDDLKDATVAYPAHTGIDPLLAAARLAHPRIRFKAVDVVSSDVLIARVSEGAIDYAIVPSRDAAAARNIHLDFDVAFPAGARGDFAWAVASGEKSLRDALDAFIARLRGDGTLARLADRYNAAPDEVERVDAGVFQDRIRQLLPQWRRTFVEAQAQSGIEWRLLAAVAYQESQWDPQATSETGVRGFMQLTADTARGLGVADRLDPRSSAIGAARYIADLKNKLPARIAEPDRTWFALAAFNIGIGHLEDARILAQRHKLNPDLWSDVRKMLPLLADPKYYLAAKNGYARGGMPVAFVGRVRGYYDILLRTQSAQPPLLQASLALR